MTADWGQKPDCDTLYKLPYLVKLVAFSDPQWPHMSGILAPGPWEAGTYSMTELCALREIIIWSNYGPKRHINWLSTGDFGHKPTKPNLNQPNKCGLSWQMTYLCLEANPGRRPETVATQIQSDQKHIIWTKLTNSNSIQFFLAKLWDSKMAISRNGSFPDGPTHSHTHTHKPVLAAESKGESARCN